MPFIKLSTEGSKEIQVRAVLAGVFALAIIGGFFCKYITADSFMGIATMAITYYFAKRGTEENKTTP
jgi:uncharacterized membrane protein YoaK (UPF0700 family)